MATSVFRHFSFHRFLNLGNSKKTSKTIKNKGRNLCPFLWKPGSRVFHHYSELQNVRAAWLPFQPSHLFVLSTAEHQNEHLLGSTLSTYTHLPLSSHNNGAGWSSKTHPRTCQGNFCYHALSNVLKRHINLVYLALVYATIAPQTNTCLSFNGNQAALSFRNQLQSQPSPTLTCTLQNVVIFLESSLFRFPGTKKTDKTGGNQKLFCRFADCNTARCPQCNQYTKRLNR